MAFYLKEITKTSDPQLMASFEADRQNVAHCSLFHHFANTAVVATGRKGFIQLVNLANGSFQTFLTHLDGVMIPMEAPLRFIAMSPALYLAHRECHHAFYALAHGSELLCANFNTGTVSTIANFSSRPSAIFAEDGEYVACGTSDGEVHVWRATTLLYDGALLRTRPQGVANMSIERSMLLSSMAGGGNNTTNSQHHPSSSSHNSSSFIGGPTTLPNENGEVYPATFVNDSGSVLFRIKATKSAGISALSIYRDLLVVAADDFTVTVHNMAAMNPSSSSYYHSLYANTLSGQDGEQQQAIPAGTLLFHLAHPAARVKGIVGMSPIFQRLCVASEKGCLTVYEKIDNKRKELGGMGIGGERHRSSSATIFDIVGSYYMQRRVNTISYHNNFVIVGTADGKVVVFDAKDDIPSSTSASSRGVTSSASGSQPSSGGVGGGNFSATANPILNELVSFDVKHSVVRCDILADDRLVVVTSSGDVWRWPMADVMRSVLPERLLAAGGKQHHVNGGIANNTAADPNATSPSSERNAQSSPAANDDDGKVMGDEDEEEESDENAPPSATNALPPIPTSIKSLQQNYIQQRQPAENLFAFDEDALDGAHNDDDDDDDDDKDDEDGIASSVPERATVVSADGTAAVAHHRRHSSGEVKKFPSRVSVGGRSSQFERDTNTGEEADAKTTMTTSSILKKHSNPFFGRQGTNSANPKSVNISSSASQLYYDPRNYSAEKNGDADEDNEADADVTIHHYHHHQHADDNDARSHRRANSRNSNDINKYTAAEEALQLYEGENDLYDDDQEDAAEESGHEKGGGENGLSRSHTRSSGEAEATKKNGASSGHRQLTTATTTSAVSSLKVSIEGLKEGKRMDPRRVAYGLSVADRMSTQMQLDDDHDDEHRENNNKSAAALTKGTSLFDRNNALIKRPPHFYKGGDADDDDNQNNNTNVAAAGEHNTSSTSTIGSSDIEAYAAANPTLTSALKLKHGVRAPHYGRHEKVFSAVPELAEKLYLGNANANGNADNNMMASSRTSPSRLRSPPSNQRTSRLTPFDVHHDDDDNARRNEKDDSVVGSVGSNASLPSQMQGSEAGGNKDNMLSKDAAAMRSSLPAHHHHGSSPILVLRTQRPASASPAKSITSHSAALVQTAAAVTKEGGAASANIIVGKGGDDLVDSTFAKFARKKDEKYEREKLVTAPNINKHGCEDLLFYSGGAHNGSSMARSKMITAMTANNTRSGNNNNKNNATSPSSTQPLSDRTRASVQSINTTVSSVNSKGDGGAVKKKNAAADSNGLAEDKKMYVSRDGEALIPPPATTIFFSVPSLEWGAGGGDVNGNNTLFGTGPFQDFFIQSLPMAQ